MLEKIQEMQKKIELLEETMRNMDVDIRMQEQELSEKKSEKKEVMSKLSALRDCIECYKESTIYYENDAKEKQELLQAAFYDLVQKQAEGGIRNDDLVIFSEIACLEVDIGKEPEQKDSVEIRDTGT